MPKYNWSKIGAVRVRYFMGRVNEFESLEEAVRAVGWRVIDSLDMREFGPDLSDWVRGQEFSLTRTQVVFQDDLGLVIPVAIVRRVAMEQGLHAPVSYWGRWRPRRRRSHPWTYVFRDGPVPGVHCSRASRRGLPMRRMRTTQEISEAVWLEYDDDAIEHRLKDRPCRRKLPTWWDDRQIGDWKARSWKNYRSHQWKPR